MTSPSSPSVALVTGASSGIGRELAEVLAGEGHDVMLVARRRERLEELARRLATRHGVSARVIANDLEDPGTPDEIFRELEAERITVDILVNNAGLGIHGRFWKTDLSRQLAVIGVNLTALTKLTGIFLPGMVSRRRGRILNVASTAAFQPGPYMSVYYATKAYVLSFSEALAEELSGTGVTVTALCPGPVVTEFQERAGVRDTWFTRGPLVVDSAKVARVGWAAAKRGKRVVIPGLGNKLLMETVRFSPRRLITAVVGRIQKGRSGEPR